MSPELVAIIAAAVMILGFLRSLRLEVAAVGERMARLEGLFEGFTRREPPASPA